MNADKPNEFSGELQRKRGVVLAEVCEAETELDEIAALQEPEMVERAQGASAATVLGNLEERARNELADIDVALRRIQSGEYGVCQSCESEIPTERLRAVPEAQYCIDCAETDGET